ncbi:MAG: protein translocase subunit SecD [Actinobacteria bacterium]|nr:protein translocase subunit SecD [Actinomycetota bacterium]
MASVTTAYRAGRVLAYFSLLTVLMGVWTFWPGGSSTPRLGLDLRGGTQVILTPKQVEGQKVTDSAMKQAVSIIRQRVNAFGVSEAEVSVQGQGANSTIIVSIPGKTNSDVIDSLKSTAKLDFRPVLDAASGIRATVKPGTGTASPAPTTPAVLPPVQSATDDAAFRAQYANIDCTAKGALVGGVPVDPTKYVATCDREGAQKFVLAPARVLGTQISKAAPELPTQGVGSWQVALTLNGKGATDFATVTSEITKNAAPKNQLGIVLDGMVFSAPSVNEAILGGRAVISGNFTQKTATDLANVLKYGALPISLDVASSSQLSPSLGNDQLKGGVLAGLIGLIIVALYLLIYYRALGLIALASLGLAGGITYFAVVLLGNQLGLALTLAGVAGLIVAIGVTADSFIVYFERLRDEVREGRSIKSAATSGWNRARRTILAADGVSLLAAVVLYFLSVGGVRGFAFTLGLTTVIDIFVAFFFTRPLVEFAVRSNWFARGSKMTGLNPERLGVAPRPTPAAAGTSIQE